MGENSFNDANDKGLISNIYKQLINSIARKKKIEKRAEDLDISPKKTYGWPTGR